MFVLADKNRFLTALQLGKINLQGQFVNSSNYTFLGELEYEDLKMPVVYKPMRGEQPLWDFPLRTLARREVAAFVVSENLGWDLVPPTVYRRSNTPYGPGSLQLYIQHDSAYNYFQFSKEDRQRLRPVVVFDLLINNADRKGGHVLCGPDGHLWVIDHGTCFNIDEKLRTVIWDFVGEPIPSALLENLSVFAAALDAHSEPFMALKSFLRIAEIQALARRARAIVLQEKFPEPDMTRRPYPWPPV